MGGKEGRKTMGEFNFTFVCRGGERAGGAMMVRPPGSLLTDDRHLFAVLARSYENGGSRTLIIESRRGKFLEIILIEELQRPLLSDLYILSYTYLEML